MVVRLDADKKYRDEADPWGIGGAESERYNACRDLVLRHSARRGSILDIGCGLGAFLARFEGHFAQLVGVDISSEAVRRGRNRFPFIRFAHGSAADLAGIEGLNQRFDAIIFSDVIYYLSYREQNASLRWIADHLHDDGVVLVAAWSPGGGYLTHEELRRMAARHLRIEEETAFDTQHVALVGRRKRFLLAITVDYETWQPVPPGKKIDLEADVLGPTNRLLDLADSTGAKLSFMAEMGEYFSFASGMPAIARRMEQQWALSARRGHDVQLHLHPAWLPEAGAEFREGEWRWDLSRSRANDFKGDLSAVIAKCKTRLEELLAPVDPTYRVTCFRAGGYQVQPFRRLHDALVANDIVCDTSVWRGGLSRERGYDFRLAYSSHQPYFANSLDPQLRAPSHERQVIELPISTLGSGERWSIDHDGPRTLPGVLRGHLRETLYSPWSTYALRKTARVRECASAIYYHPAIRRRWATLNALIPRQLVHALSSFQPEAAAGHEYFVLIGHTKVERDWEALETLLRALANEPRLELVRLSEMAAIARKDLEQRHRATAADELCFQVVRERSAVMGEERNHAQSKRLQDLIPLDRERVLDLGCGAGHWSASIASRYPWMAVTGVDAGKDFIAKARTLSGAERVSFQVGDFHALPLAEGSFDCVHADNSLEHAFDVDRALQEAWRVLRVGGALVAAIPSDARNPGAAVDSHAWKTAPHEVELRLALAGFKDIRVEEVDTWRELGTAPYPPSLDRMMYVLAWKRSQPTTQRERALEAMAWVYRRLDPARSQETCDPADIVAGGHAWCSGYAAVLCHLLQREGIPAGVLFMRALGHARGHGTLQAETHAVVSCDVDGRACILDPMANTLIPYSIEELLARPQLAVAKEHPDARYVQRQYCLYDTEYWYSRIVERKCIGGRMSDESSRAASLAPGILVEGYRSIQRLRPTLKPGRCLR